MATFKLTPKELNLLTAVVSSSEIKVTDWAAIATKADMKTGKYARDTWTTIRKKLGAEATKASSGEDTTNAATTATEDAETENKAGKKTKKTPTITPRKRKKTTVDEDEDNGFQRRLTKTPSSRPNRKAKKADVRYNEDDEDVDDGEIVVPVPMEDVFGGDAAVAAAMAGSVAKEDGHDAVFEEDDVV